MEWKGGGAGGLTCVESWALSLSRRLGWYSQGEGYCLAAYD